MKKRIVSLALVVAISIMSTGCGTLFHKSRINRPASNKVDYLIVILDCCGFFFGIIPGVVALVIDINNQTIYYSASEVSFLNGQPDVSQMMAIHVDSMDKATISAALSNELGRNIEVDDLPM